MKDSEDLHPLVEYEDDPRGDTVHHPYSAYNQGYQAYEDGYARRLNPYVQGTRESDYWYTGFDESKEHEEYFESEWNDLLTNYSLN